MKRKEFLSRLEYLGYKGKQYEHNHFINVLDEDGKFVAYVSEIKEYDYEMYSITDEMLVSLIFEYTKTNIEDREEEPLLLLALPNCSYSRKYLEINIENQKEYRIQSRPKTKGVKIRENVNTKEVQIFKMVFTKSEIEKLENQRFIKSLHTEYFEGDSEDESNWKNF